MAKLNQEENRNDSFHSIINVCMDVCMYAWTSHHAGPMQVGRFFFLIPQSRTERKQLVQS